MHTLGCKEKRTLQTLFMGFAVVFVTLLGLCALVGCSDDNKESANSGSNSTKEISVYSREDGSGTRSAFVELFGLEEKDSNGNKQDMTTNQAAITNSTSVMMTSVSSDPAAIGYISLGSLDDSVKAVKIDGVEATPENVKQGSYPIARSFNMVTKDAVSDAAQDFITFIMSADGQSIVADNKYIPVDEKAAAYSASGASGKVVIAGSSSVSPVMEKLAEAYQQANPDVTVEIQTSDSTTGITMAAEGSADIGMASRDLKESESSKGLLSIELAKDGIAVIVSPDAEASDLTRDQVKDIFSGTVTTWADILG